ncbi:bifunctional aminoglycoside phosphotransferase/ATP-binding protein [Methylomonas sp. 11b]|uniref:bifunctional aminoglycoside phosphotransferase/ATP-binding protein n=1 Tax=Methylomonas sp. 11b TaxID=1168169 RepID=UPI00047BCAD7|nr:bifunctional aminoglycoside phosphotransferase/ATP-binding protein [Methylomonas sp. 11b]
MANAYPPLIAALCDPACFPHPVKRVTVLETHISWVLLAGRYAYKIKKPVDLGFLDFSQLSQRHFYCQEEIRLNRRLAPGIYLQVTAIGGSPGQPGINAEPAFEYAVKMRRFAAGKLLDTLLTRGEVTPAHIDSLADTIARFHMGLAPATPDSNYGSPTVIEAPARQNFQQLLELMKPEDATLIKLLQERCRQAFLTTENLFEQRQQSGFIRECHGDLHLGNIVLLRDRPVAFDGIEFSPELRWIDTISDAAFLIMDLLHRGRGDLAYRFLNAYLQISGDYAGLGVLRFYLSYRAAVRAKIAGYRFAQTAEGSARQACLTYLDLAGSSLCPRKPALILTHGLPGCGKSAVSQILLEKHQLIRLRSDVERKRLFGLNALQKSGSAINSGIYDPQASQKTYQHLLDLAQALLGYGFPVIVDAAFLKHAQRRPFQLLAQNLGIPFVILSIQAKDKVLRQRIRHRQEQGRDASEADLTVLDKATAGAEALQTEELPYNVILTNNTDGLDRNDQQAAWRELERTLE